MGRVMLISVVFLLAFCPLLKGQSATSKPSDEMLPEDTRWAGTLLRDPRIATSKDRPCKARITERDGQKFAANVTTTVGGNKLTVKIEGKVDKGGNIRALVTQVIDGEADAVGKEWSGKCNKKELLLEWTAKNGAHRRAELRLSTGKNKDGKDESE
jgi:hypothetical protein